MVDFVALHATCLVRGRILSVLYRRLPASGLLKIIFLLVPLLVAEVPVEEDTIGCSMEELIPAGSVMHPGLQVYTPRPRWSVGTTANSTAVPLQVLKPRSSHFRRFVFLRERLRKHRGFHESTKSCVSGVIASECLFYNLETLIGQDSKHQYLSYQPNLIVHCLFKDHCILG